MLTQCSRNANANANATQRNATQRICGGLCLGRLSGGRAQVCDVFPHLPRAECGAVLGAIDLREN